MTPFLKPSRHQLAVLLALCLVAGCVVRPRSKPAAPPPGQASPPLTPQEQLVQDAIDQFDQATAVLTSITDRASAARAAPKLKAIAQKLEDLHRKGVPLGSEVQEKPQATGRLRDDLEKAIQRYANAAVQKLAQENLLGPEFQDALRELGKLPQ